MNNLISVFMNYKINRLIEYGVFAFGKDTPFIRNVLKEYFSTYVDNYYYGVFNTIDDERYNERNLKLELKGIMEEMLDDYRACELQVGNEEYQEGRQTIEELHDLSFDILKIDTLEINEKEDIPQKVFDFVASNKRLRELIEGRESHLSKLVRETYQTCQKLLNYEDNYYHMESREFHRQKELAYYELIPSIKVLDVYRKNMVNKIYDDDRIAIPKLECLIQKISFDILKKTLNHEKVPLYFIPFCDEAISRGRIVDSVFDLIDNPLFQKYVVLGVNYNLYLNQESAFSEDFQFACIQDFTHINDIYQKTETIAKEAIFNYLIVSDCRYQDREYFVNYEGSSIKVLVFEEE